MRRRWLTLLGALAVGALLSPGTGYAAPGVVASGVKTTTGQVDFTLSVRELPTGTKLDDATVTVTALDKDLPAAVSVASKPDKAAQRSVVVVFDASGSMAEGNALPAARAAAAGYAKALPGDVALGLVAVSETPTTMVAPTRDRRAFTGALDQIVPEGDTALYDGVQRALGLLTGDDQRIVVLSDGRDTASKGSLDALTTTLAKRKVPVDVVSLGVEIDREALDRLAKASGGATYPANDTSGLAEAFRAAARSFTARLLVTAEVPDALAGRTAPMRIDVAVGGRTLSTSVDVTFAALPERARVLPAVRQAPVPSWLLLLVVGFVFVALFMVLLTITDPILVGAPRRRRMAQFQRYLGRPGAVTQDAPGVVARTALEWSQRYVAASNREQRMIHRLDRAGMSVRPSEWLLIRVCAVFTSVVVLWLLLPWWAGIPLGLLVGCGGTWAYRRIRTRMRIKAFAEQLPDALQLVIGSLRSGFSLAQALAALVRESRDPISTEIGRALAEARLGSELEDALTRVVRRTDSDDLEWAVMAIRIQREVGGNLAEVLQTAVNTMRERGQLRRHVKALSAEGRLSAYILVAIPIFLFLFMFAVRREYISLLYTTGLGIFMLVVMTILIALGGFVMSRLVKVEV